MGTNSTPASDTNPTHRREIATDEHYQAYVEQVARNRLERDPSSYEHVANCCITATTGIGTERTVLASAHPYGALRLWPKDVLIHSDRNGTHRPNDDVTLREYAVFDFARNRRRLRIARRFVRVFDFAHDLRRATESIEEVEE